MQDLIIEVVRKPPDNRKKQSELSRELIFIQTDANIDHSYEKSEVGFSEEQ